MTDLPVREIITRVSRSDWGENQYRGHAVFAEMVGTDGFWSTLSLGIGGPRLTPDEAQLLDDVSVCAIAADPRIWPLKITRLVSAYGSGVAGFTAGCLTLHADLVGPQHAGPAASALVDLAAELGDQASERDEIERTILRRLDRGEKLSGFGVPFREEDERLVALRACMVKRGFSKKRYWALLDHLDAIVFANKRVHANMASGIAAAALDLGFTPANIQYLAMALVFPQFLANAVEGAEQAPEVLRRLPSTAITYVGHPSRKSDRFDEGSRREP